MYSFQYSISSETTKTSFEKVSIPEHAKEIKIPEHASGRKIQKATSDFAVEKSTPYKLPSKLLQARIINVMCLDPTRTRWLIPFTFRTSRMRQPKDSTDVSEERQLEGSTDSFLREMQRRAVCQIGCCCEIVRAVLVSKCVYHSSYHWVWAPLNSLKPTYRVDSCGFSVITVIATINPDYRLTRLNHTSILQVLPSELTISVVPH